MAFRRHLLLPTVSYCLDNTGCPKILQSDSAWKFIASRYRVISRAFSKIMRLYLAVISVFFLFFFCFFFLVKSIRISLFFLSFFIGKFQRASFCSPLLSSSCRGIIKIIVLLIGSKYFVHADGKLLHFRPRIISDDYRQISFRPVVEWISADIFLRGKITRSPIASLAILLPFRHPGKPRNHHKGGKGREEGRTYFFARRPHPGHD